MSKAYLSFSVISLSLLLALMPVGEAGSKNAVNTIAKTSSSYLSKKNKEGIVEAASALYNKLHLDKIGLPLSAFQYAYKGYQYLNAKGVLGNPGVMTICDFSQSSSKRRMYIIDVENIQVLLNTYVAHGKNSGLQYANRFSNRPESLQSSLGFFVTKNTYFGKHGLSLRLGGLEKGINDKAETRAVVVHGASYIGDNRLGAPYMGRSWGCPAVPQTQATKVINLIKDGTCLFIYHPNANYLHGSKILNG